jgi:hypothetical protein
MMAVPIGAFDPLTVEVAWFEPEYAQIHGRFDKDLGTPPVFVPPTFNAAYNEATRLTGVITNALSITLIVAKVFTLLHEIFRSPQ